MSGDTFFKTRMGQTFFERTLPDLVNAIQTLSSHLKTLLSVAEPWLAQQPRPADPPPPVDSGPEGSMKTVYVDTVYTGSRVQPIHGQRVRICGVFREHESVSVDLATATRPPANVQRWSDVAADCWAYVAAFTPKGWMSPTLDAVSVLDLECFAHLLPSRPKGQP
jgi:hypothetical protein